MENINTFIPLRQKDIIADMHTHTIYSRHAFSTLKENLDAAILHGMKYIANTDHRYSSTLSVIDQKNEEARISLINRVNPYYGTSVISSMEFNLNREFKASDESICNKLVKYRLFGLHSWFYDIPNMNLNVLPILFELAIADYSCNAFAHIEREINQMLHGSYGIEVTPTVRDILKEIVDIAKYYDVLLEVNESSLKNDNYGNTERMRCWLEMACDNGNRIVLGSDAHFCEEVGIFTNSIALLNELQYPRDLIINCNEEEIKKFLI